MKNKWLEIYKSKRAKVRTYLRFCTVMAQTVGALILQASADNLCGQTLIGIGFISGLILLLQSNSAKEAFLNTAVATLTIPALTLIILLSVIILGIVINPSNITGGNISKFSSIAFGMLQMVIVAAWPIVIATLAIKIISVKIFKRFSVLSK